MKNNWNENVKTSEPDGIIVVGISTWTGMQVVGVGKPPALLEKNEKKKCDQKGG